MNKAIRTKLFLMMVLEFFIWGAWFPLIFAYLLDLGFTPAQQSWVLNAFPIAAIVGMFFSNQFADRNSRRSGSCPGSSHQRSHPPLACTFVWPCFAAMMIHCLL